MACQRPSPIVWFEQDAPDVTFLVTSDGEPFRFNNTAPELHIITPDGTHVAQSDLGVFTAGVLTLRQSGLDELAELAQDISYSAQIFIKAIAPLGEGVGLYDIVEPYWSDYIPPESHVPGYYSGEVRLDQTVPTQIPWDVREAFKLRGS